MALTLSRFKHLTPRYVSDRVRQKVYEHRHADAPWLTADIIAFLDQWLKPADRGLEWGGGRSTAWLIRRIAHLTTIEENPAWGKRIGSMLHDLGASERVDLHVIPIDESSPGISNPYVAVATGIAPGSLDFALVDGDMRDYCALAVLDRLKPGGLLIIDNVERYLPRKDASRSPNARSLSDGFPSAEWERLAREIADWRCFWTTDGVSDTAVWMRP